MTFAVTFKCHNYCDCVVAIDCSPAGLRALDEARSHLGPHITHIAEPRGFYCFETWCDVSETQARRASGVFGYALTAEVVVPPAALNQYVKAEWRLMPGSETIAKRAYSIDSDAIVKDWINAGAPLGWVPVGYEPVAKLEETANQ